MKILTSNDLKAKATWVYGGVSSKLTTGVSCLCHNMLVEGRRAGKLLNLQLRYLLYIGNII